MNENKIMVLLLGEEINTDWWCEKCQAYIDDRQVIYQEIHEICGCPVYIKEPVYHDLEGWMTGETIRKIQAKMPGTWNKYGIYCGNEVREMQGINLMKAMEYMLSLSNFITYLREHKEEWAYVECNVDCFGNDDFYKPDDCMGCDGKNRQILNPAYAEALRELEEGE
jgi:hypothetical protein